VLIEEKRRREEEKKRRVDQRIEQLHNGRE